MEKIKRILALIRLTFLVVLVLLAGRVAVRAETAVGGTIGIDTVWSSLQSPYLVTSDLRVASGATLTIEPGVTVRFRPATRLTVQDGALRAKGTVAAPVILTSERDITGGTPAPGDWEGLHFTPDTNDAATILDYVTVRFGATTNLVGASPTFNHCRFEQNSGYALAIDLASYPHGKENSAVYNGVDAIRVPAGEMTASGAWDLTGIPYFLEGAVSIGVAPAVAGITPSLFEQGSAVDAVISGTRLAGVKQVTFGNAGVTATILPGGTDTAVPVHVTVSADVPLGSVGLVVTVAAGSGTLSPGITVTPPVPVITALAPDTIFINRPTTTIDISGRNFIASSLAYLDGAALATTFVSATMLKADVPTQPVQAGRLIQVKNPDPRTPGAVIASNSSAFTVNLPQFAFNPATLTLRQEEAGRELNLTIPYAAPAGGVTATLTSTNTAAATVPATVVIPEGASSASVPVTALKTSVNRDVALEVHANQTNWLGGKAAVTVRPQPTVNLVPTTILTGQSFSLFLTVTLTDPAPAGGLTVSLTASPAGVVSVPASLIIAAGATSGQVTVIATGTGTTTITATPANGSGFLTGDTSQITVKPIQTFGIGPILSPPVGVMLPTSTPSTPATTYNPVMSKAVGVTAGSVMTGLVPDHGAIGTTDMLVRVNGYGLSSATTVSFMPSDGITVKEGTLFAATDGSYVEAHIAIDANAPVSQRTVIVSTASGVAKPASPGANIFNVTFQPPQLWSLLPNFGLTGNIITLQVNGRNLQQAAEIEFIPPDGISLGNPPSVNSDGSLATLNISIAANAATGPRAVKITTIGGMTPEVLSAANAFDVRSAVPLTGSAYAAYTPIVSMQVGVSVQTTAPVVPQTTYSMLASLPVGVAVGPVIASVVPESGAIGSTGLTLRVNGAGLASAASMNLNPATGITIRPSTFTAAADGSYVEAVIDIAQDAPLAARTVVLSGVSAPPASPGANQFKVTLPVPQILAIQPIRQAVGSTFTLTMNGVNLTSASSIDFSPATGISVNNPPTVNSDGTMATVTVVIAANAPIGARVVTVTAPGGTTSTIAAAANTFTVTADTGVSYASLTSQAVGVLVLSTTSTTTQPVTYGPILSVPVGVDVTPAPAPTNQNVSYGPVVSRLVGVSVGASVTGITPNTIEPGTTTGITLHGVGLGQVNGMQIQPPTGFTIGTPIVASDGLSVTVSITADAGVPVGTKTLIASSPSGTIPVASVGANLLLTGPKPVINSIVPNLQTAGTTFTLVIHGTHLQGATEVRIVPADGILVNNPPTYYTDGQGEHASVTIIIDSAATGGNRAVVIDTPYGSTDTTATAANTLTVYQPASAWKAPATGDEKPVYARSITDAPVPPQKSGSRLISSNAALASAVTRIREGKRLAALIDVAHKDRDFAWSPGRERGFFAADDRNRDHQFSGFRGPPERSSIPPGGRGVG